MFKSLSNFETTSVTEEIVRSFIERDFSTKVADLALKITEGDETDRLQDVRGFVDEYEHVAQIIKDEADVIHGDIEGLLTAVHSATGSGYDWRMDCLNKTLGPLRKGNFVVVGKRPETGGTTFTASEVTYMASQMEEGKRVMWFNNEEAGLTAVKPRIISAAIGRSSKDIAKDPAKATKDYLDSMGGEDKVIVFDPSYLSTGYIDKKLSEMRDDVGLIVIDQLWKVHSTVSKQTNDVQRITNLFNKAREWAKEYSPVIAVHQADGSASNVRYIEMDQLHMSKTGIQGEADAIITIGKTNEAGYENTRFINVPKNKLTGGPLSDPTFRHATWEVKIDAEIARFKD
ncbi:AAA family ATPase [Gammaproteobacteria bacterium]|nr:AAA family ATPase [Gammaproteobacteria bacterium]